MLAIQEFISSFDSINEAAPWLKSKLGILVKEGNLFGKPLWQCSSARGAEDLISRECDGLVMDRNAKTVCLPPLRPKLLKDIHDSRVDWSKVHMMEREEGMRVMVFFYDESWHICTDRSVSGNDSIKVDKNITSTIRFELITRMNRDFGNWQAVFDYPDNDNYCFIFNYNWEYSNGVAAPKKPTLTLERITDRLLEKEIESDEVSTFAEMFGFERPVSVLIHGTSLPSEKEKVNRLVSPLAMGIEITDSTGEKYFLSNKLYNSLYVAKLASSNVLPIHILNITRNCRDSKDLEKVKRTLPKFVPLIDILLSAEVELVNSLALIHEAKSVAGIMNKPGAVLKIQQDILDSALKNIGEDKSFTGLRKAMSLVRADKIITYARAIDGKRIQDEIERLRGIETWS